VALELGKQNLYYASRILEEIWLHRVSSRAGISESLQVDKSTVTTIVNQLLDHGLLGLRDDGDAAANLKAGSLEVSPPRRGRRRRHLTIRRDFGVMLGFEVQPEAISTVAIDLSGRRVASRRTTTNGEYGSNVAEKFGNYLSELLSEWSDRIPPILGAGVGVSGIVDPDDGTIQWSMPLGVLSPFDFLAALSEPVPFPVRVENDAKCASWGPLVFDRLEHRTDYLTLVIEFEESDPAEPVFDRISAGLGLVVNGAILHGPDNTAGEFRSSKVDEGSLGQFSMEHHDLIRIKEDKGLRREFLLEVAQNIGYLVNVLNLQAVYLGGGIERYEQELRPLIREQIHEKWLYNHMSQVECPVVFLESGVSPAAYGAASMMLRQLFTSLPAPEARNELLEYAFSRAGDV